MDAELRRQVLANIKKGDEFSFRFFFNFYYSRFFRVAHFYLKNNENAEEVVMDVFAKFWKKRKKLPEIVDFNSYAYSTVKNHSINFIKRKRIDTKTLDEYSASKMIEYVEPEKLYLGRELAKELEKEISGLPPRCQLIYRMIREDGLKYKEVASTLGISIKAIENQMLIAMKKIRKVLDNYENDIVKKESIIEKRI